MITFTKVRKGYLSKIEERCNFTGRHFLWALSSVFVSSSLFLDVEDLFGP